MHVSRQGYRLRRRPALTLVAGGIARIFVFEVIKIRWSLEKAVQGVLCGLLVMCIVRAGEDIHDQRSIVLV